MQVSNFVVFGVVEVFVLLTAVCVFLLVHTRNLKNLIKRLQEKVQALVADLSAAKAAQKTAARQSSREVYKKQINDQLLLTRRYHLELDANRDIALDLGPETPLPRQIAALRHAFLIAEKEALHASGDTGPDWPVLENKLHQLIQFYNSTAAADSAARIESSQQHSQQQKEQEQESANCTKGMDNTVVEAPAKDRVSTIEITRTESDRSTLEEVRQLRQVAEEQQQLIGTLQQKLAAAGTDEEKATVIRELNEQLDRQTRVIRESETCIQLLEEELTMSNNRIKEMEDTLDNANREIEHIPKMKKMIRQFTEESKTMLERLAELEQHNEALLRNQTRDGAGGDEPAAVER